MQHAQVRGYEEHPLSHAQAAIRELLEVGQGRAAEQAQHRGLAPTVWATDVDELALPHIEQALRVHPRDPGHAVRSGRGALELDGAELDGQGVHDVAIVVQVVDENNGEFGEIILVIFGLLQVIEDLPDPKNRF